MGNYSTPILAENCNKLTSIETDKEWFSKVRTSNSDHRQILWSADNVQDYLLANNDQYDFAFVDGPVKSRVPCIHNLFDRTDLIMFHDSTTRCYRWDQLNVPYKYKRFDYLALSPTTSIFSSNSDHWSILDGFLQ